MKNFNSNGKLLLTGEYLVLDGAKSLALPTKYGQQLYITPTDNANIYWESYDENNNIWFTDKLSIETILKSDFSSKNEITQRLIQILKSVHDLNPSLLTTHGFKIKTTQNFNRAWGLGTSSTLINNIANWANIDAYKLLELTFGGSGYDIACAQYDNPIAYQLINKTPQIKEVNFDPVFKDYIYFVYLNQKQNSRDGIANYRRYKGNLTSPILSINGITERIILSDNLTDFEMLIEEHEHIISEIINQRPIKEKRFTDFNGAVKSLGAWGGDFVMVTSEIDPSAYFNSKGYDTVIKYSDMIKA